MKLVCNAAFAAVFMLNFLFLITSLLTFTETYVSKFKEPLRSSLISSFQFVYLMHLLKITIQ